MPFHQLIDGKFCSDNNIYILRRKSAEERKRSWDKRPIDRQFIGESVANGHWYTFWKGHAACLILPVITVAL